MADQIPGRRITGGESFYIDWTSRGGDSMLLRVEALKIVSSAEVQFVVETRDQPGGTITTPVTPTVCGPVCETLPGGRVGLAVAENPDYWTMWKLRKGPVGGRRAMSSSRKCSGEE